MANRKKIPGAYVSATPKNVLAMGYRPVRTFFLPVPAEQLLSPNTTGYRME